MVRLSFVAVAVCGGLAAAIMGALAGGALRLDDGVGFGAAPHLVFNGGSYIGPMGRAVALDQARGSAAAEPRDDG